MPVGTNPDEESPINRCLRGVLRLKTFISSRRQRVRDHKTEILDVLNKINNRGYVLDGKDLQ
jgi:hypothetical protein